MSIYLYRGSPAWKGREGPGRRGRGGHGGRRLSSRVCRAACPLPQAAWGSSSAPFPGQHFGIHASHGAPCVFFFFFLILFRFIFCKNLILNSLDAIFFILSIDSSWERRTRNTLHVANAAGLRLQEGSGATAGPHRDPAHPQPHPMSTRSPEAPATRLPRGPGEPAVCSSQRQLRTPERVPGGSGKSRGWKQSSPLPPLQR